MMRKMDMLWIGAKARISQFLGGFLRQRKKGAAEIVAIILIIVCCDCIGSCF